MTVETQAADTGYVSQIKVQPDYTPDGDRIVVVTAGEDAALPIGELPAALAYAACVFGAADAVDYNMAVYRQMIAREVSVQGAIDTLNRFLDRQSFEVSPTSPLEFIPSFSFDAGTGLLEASVLVSINGQPFEHWPPDYARAHAAKVLSTYTNVRLDLLYQQYLVEDADTDVATAATLVADVYRWHPSTEAH